MRRARGPVELIGADLLDGLGDPVVFWAVDATPLAIRAALPGRLPRVVSPKPGDRPRRSGPSVALLVDDARVAGEYLAALLPVPVVPVLFRGAHRADESTLARIGHPVHPEAGEAGEDTVARVVAEIDRLHREDIDGWWTSLREPATPAGPPAPAGSWRQQWDRTAPRPRTDSPIWRSTH